jgi:RNA polymerase sigma factor (sigma-70 family)
MSNPTTHTIDDLMAHMGWLRRLAGGLLHDSDAADEAAQQALISAVRQPPQKDGSLRAWFGTVLVNRIRSEARGERRHKAAAERAAALAPPEPIRSPEEITGSLELQRQVATLLLELPELYRQVVYMRFFDDLDASAIGARLGIPAGTVRWRLKMGLDQLRARLDADDGERGKRWRRALAPLALGGGGGRGATAGRPVPLSTVAAAALAVVVVGGVALLARGPGADKPSLIQEISAGADDRRGSLPPPAFLSGAPRPPGGVEAVRLAAAGGGSPAAQAGPEETWSRLAPFTGVRWRGDVPEVEVNGVWADLVSVDGIATDKIVAFCQRRYAGPEGLWQKRFAEDLVEVLTAMNHPPGERVTLVLATLSDGARSEVEAPLTAESRRRVLARNQQGTAVAAGAREFRKVSPFTGLRAEGETLKVEIDGTWYQLVRLQGVTTERLVAFAKQTYKERWLKRLAEDIYEVLLDLGAKPGDTVDVTVKETGGRLVERKALPMTAENRKRVKENWGPK